MDSEPWPPAQVGHLRLSEGGQRGEEYTYYDPDTGHRWHVRAQQLAKWGNTLCQDLVKTFGRLEAYDGTSAAEVLVRELQRETLPPMGE